MELEVSKGVSYETADLSRKYRMRKVLGVGGKKVLVRDYNRGTWVKEIVDDKTFRLITEE